MLDDVSFLSIGSTSRTGMTSDRDDRASLHWRFPIGKARVQVSNGGISTVLLSRASHCVASQLAEHHSLAHACDRSEGPAERDLPRATQFQWVSTPE